MKVIDLLNKIANGEEVPLIKYRNKILHWNKEKDRFEDKDGMNTLYEMDFSELSDEIEVIEEENELHANSVEFNINNDKRDCIIILEENDLGIDKLHLDNCYFYKENGKWYVKKYDFKTINIEEDKKIEKISEITFRNSTDNIKEEVLLYKINEIIDILNKDSDKE